MDKREKALNGLKCCACPSGACGICPYFKDRSEPCVTIMAADVLEMLKEQQETIELQESLLTLAHAAMTHGKKEGLTNGARPGRNRENPASHV